MIRRANEADLAAVAGLFRAFDREVPEPSYRESELERELEEIEAMLRDDFTLVAEEDGQLVGYALSKREGSRYARLTDLYVAPQARGRGLSRGLVQAVATHWRGEGIETLELEVLESNNQARAIYERWGFAPVEHVLAAPLEALANRLVREQERGPTFGSIHVQTDDSGAVARTVQKVLPRLGRSAGTSVTGPRNGWVAVHDELSDRDPQALHRLAKELSYALGGVVLAIGVEEGALVRYTLYDRGGAVDEYASVPEFRGELPPGDVVALGANPTVVSRLTGADPARVRLVARTAASPSELPPATELAEAIAEVMGIAEAGHGWAPA